MFRLPILLSYVLSVVLLTACGGASSEKGQASQQTTDPNAVLEEQVIAVHDEVMPKTSEMNALSQKLRKELDSLKTVEADPNRVQAVEEAVQQLQAADDAMMNWMRSFHDEYFQPKGKGTLNMTAEEQETYLKKELERIEQVKTTMLHSLEQARQLMPDE